jgi:hypothetical protein
MRLSGNLRLFRRFAVRGDPGRKRRRRWMFVGIVQRGEVRWEGEMGRHKKKMAEKGQRM